MVTVEASKIACPSGHPHQCASIAPPTLSHNRLDEREEKTQRVKRCLSLSLSPSPSILHVSLAEAARGAASSSLRDDQNTQAERQKAREEEDRQ